VWIATGNWLISSKYNISSFRIKQNLIDDKNASTSGKLPLAGWQLPVAKSKKTIKFKCTAYENV